MAELFQTSRANITLHISNIFKENELDRISVCKNYLLTALDGKNYKTKFYRAQQSFPRRRESSYFKAFWMPAYAGMTNKRSFSKLSKIRDFVQSFFLRQVNMIN